MRCLLNSNLDGVSFVVDETGKITGYTTNTGGADSVFPFKSGGIDLENPLWENPDATTSADFQAQTISINLEGYKAVLIKCKYFYSEPVDGRTSVTFCEVGKSAQMMVCSNTPPATSGGHTSRGVTINTDSVVFGNSFVAPTDTIAYPKAYCIPIAIYGIE